MRDIRPLRGKPDRAPAVADAIPAKRATKLADSAPSSPAVAAQPVPVTGPGKGLDRRSQDRLRRGRMAIEGRLDLHGHTQADAHRALGHFIRQAYQRGLRCVLIITGKGDERADGDGEIMPDRSKGVLRRQVPLWLEGELGRMVLAVETARRQHGGNGAYYVLLRRRRDGGREPC